MKKIISLFLICFLLFNCAVITSSITEKKQQDDLVKVETINEETYYNRITLIIKRILNLIMELLTIECNSDQTGKSMLELRIKNIDNNIVKYWSCNKCQADTLHNKGVICLPKLQPITRYIVSITLLDNDICKIEGIPQDISLKKWQWFITNKTDEKITIEFLRKSSDYYVSGYVPNFIEPHTTETENVGITFHYKNETYPIVTDIYEFTIATGSWNKGVFTPDYIIYEPITVNYEHLLY